MDIRILPSLAQVKPSLDFFQICFSFDNKYFMEILDRCLALWMQKYIIKRFWEHFGLSKKAGGRHHSWPTYPKKKGRVPPSYNFNFTLKIWLFQSCFSFGKKYFMEISNFTTTTKIIWKNIDPRWVVNFCCCCCWRRMP